MKLKAMVGTMGLVCAAALCVGSAKGDTGRRNGIVVGEVDVWDERALTPLLVGVDAQLANLRFYNNEALAEAVGRLQGVTVNRSSFAAKLTTTPTIPIDTEVISKFAPPPAPAGADKAPETTPEKAPAVPPLVPSERQVKRTRDEQSVSGAVPEGTAPTSLFEVPSPQGLGAQDLLGVQTELTYQAINLRLMLTRALSHRAIKTTLGGVAYDDVRSSALFHFGISIDPPHAYKHARAEVELTLLPQESGQERPSMIAMMPAEKTYNVARISSSSQSFGAGAVVQPLSLGLNSTSAKDRMFIVKDRDTVALEHSSALAEECIQSGEQCSQSEKQKETAPSASFGWQFRPVLGGEAVTGGQRHVFALLALPVGSQKEFKGKMRIHTHWRTHHRRSHTGGHVRQGSCRTEIVDVSVDSRGNLERTHQPQVGDYQLSLAGDGKLAVTLSGQNFLPDTSISLAGQTYALGAGNLIIEDERRLRFVASASDLAFNNPLLLGRYGAPVPLYVAVPGQKLEGNAYLSPLTDTATLVKLSLQNVALGGEPPKDLLVRCGTRLFGLANQPLNIVDTGESTCVVSFKLPNEALRDLVNVTVTQVLRGPGATVEIAIKAPFSFYATEAKLLAQNTASTWLAISGSGFDESLSVEAAGVSYTKEQKGLEAVTPTLVILKADALKLQGVKQLVLKQGGDRQVLAMPGTPPPAKPTFVNPTSPPIKQDEAKAIVIEGTALDLIKEVRFGETKLTFKALDGGKKLEVMVTDTVTKAAGARHLLLGYGEGETLEFPLVVGPK